MPRKTQKKSKKKELYCAPNRNQKGITCYSKEDLVFLTQAYNRTRPNEKQIGTAGKSKAQLWRALNSKLRNECEKEWCWLEQKFVPAPYAKVMLEETFRPEMPKDWKRNPYKWLTTSDIRKVMKQYEKKYPSFVFIGPVPVDCPSAITCPLSNFNVSRLVKKYNKTKLGVVFNLDAHNKPGSHWVALFADFHEPLIIYFDSVGLPPPKPIHRFIKKLQQSIKDYWENEKDRKRDVPILVNRTRFQFGMSECGVFCMYFLIDHLQGKGIKDMKRAKMTDKKVNKFRKKYYRPD
jgi:hypothetical protein